MTDVARLHDPITASLISARLIADERITADLDAMAEAVALLRRSADVEDHARADRLEARLVAAWAMEAEA